MFATGHAGDGSPAAIDLRSADAAVWWVEKCHLDAAGSGQTHSSFADWLAKYVADLRQDCELDGIDPDGTPASREDAQDPSTRQGCLYLVFLVAALVAVAALIVVLARWLG